VITIKKDKKLDTIKLSSEYRNDILSSILKYYKEFADKPKNAQVGFWVPLHGIALNPIQIWKHFSNI